MVEEYDEKTDVLLVRKPEPQTFLLFDPGSGIPKSNSRQNRGELCREGISSMRVSLYGLYSLLMCIFHWICRPWV